MSERAGPEHNRAGSLNSPSAVATRLAAMVLLGLVAGAIAWAVETTDRLVVLAHSLDGVGQGLRLAVLMGATLLGGAGLGLVAGLLGVAGELLRERIGAIHRRFAPQLARPWLVEAVSLAGAALVVAAVLVVVSAKSPWSPEGAVSRFVRGYNARRNAIPFVAEHWLAIYRGVLALLSLAAVGVHRFTFSAGGPVAARPAARAVAGAGAAAAFVVVGLAYQYDSRPSFGRDEASLHYPLVAAYSLVLLVAVGLAARALTSMTWAVTFPRPTRRLALGLLLAGLASFGFALVSMNASQKVKALFWGRSVIARRVHAMARWAVDRDHDGFSPILGGGDTNDHDSQVHPLARDIPGNGVDENGVGGDLSPADVALAPRRPKPGEFVAVPGPFPRWQPRFTPPPGAVDVDAEAAAGAPAEAGAPAVPGAPALPHVIIISIDALRADHTSLLGGARDTTPNLARHAAGGVSFRWAMAQSTNTGHSFISLFRSSYMDAIFDRNVPTLVQLLAKAGYHTAFLNARRVDDWLSPQRWHLYRTTLLDGFEVLHLSGGLSWTAEALTDHAIAYLDRLPPGRPQLVWIHYNDVHQPRTPRPELGFGGGEADVYDAAVAYTDKHVGRLLDHARGKGILDRAITFVMADHGEGFYEHGTSDHGNAPTIEDIRVPLVVIAPGVAPAVVDAPVGLVDVAPTALVRAGLAVPPVYRGVDLLAVARGEVPGPRAIVSETPRNAQELPFLTWSYVVWPHAYLYGATTDTHEVYDLSKDPLEQHNLVDRDPATAARLRHDFGRWLDLECVQRLPWVPPLQSGMGRD